MTDPENKGNTFRKKPGTTDQGKDYEDILTAYLAIKLVNDNNVEDFKLSSNNHYFGCFDDVVLEFIENQKVSRIYAIQLKHKGKSTKTVTKDQLASPKGDFSLQKYLESFKDINKKYKQVNLNCYLYTNAKFGPCDFTLELENNKFIKVSARQISLSDNLFNTADNNVVYQFDINQNNGNDQEIDEYEEFFKHFFFYSNQRNVDNMKTYTSELFQKECFCEKLVFEKYMEFISKWSKLDGKKCYLNKETVSFKIGECLLGPLAMNAPLSGVNNSKFGLLQQCFLQFDATIFQTDEECVKRRIAEIFSHISNVDVKEASKVAKNVFIEVNKSLSFDKLDEAEKITLLWYMNKLPLILQVDGKKNILKQAEKFCHRKKFIFIGQHIDRGDCRKLQIFQNLQDLPNDSSMYKKIIQETKISLQGRQKQSLEDLIRNHEEIEEAFTPLDLVNTTDGSLRVGEDKEELPHPYIDQFLPKYMIDFEFFKQNNAESLSVINTNQKLDIIKEKISGIKLVAVEEFLKEVESEEVEESIESFPKINKIFDTDNGKIKHLERIVLVAENHCSLEEFRRICDKSPNKPCHHFYINSDNNMEWIRSNGSIEELKKFRSVSNYIPGSDIFASSNSSINLITAKPGMGKTTLMKYLKNNIPSSYWVVNISLREHFLFFGEEHSSLEMLNYFLEDQAKRMKYNDFAIKIRNIFQSKGNIVFLWDGLDEIPINCLSEVFEAIEYLSDLGFLNWITAREHLQSMLEEKFKVFALTIKEMEQEEQKSYIKKRLEAKYNETELEEFTQKIVEAVVRTEGVSFLGVPFHINILTELFLRDPKKYNKLLDSTFTVADMMEHSVEEKFNFHYKDKGGYEDTNIVMRQTVERDRKNRISQYEEVALKTFLSAEYIVDKLSSKCQELLAEIKESKDDFGIIVGVTDDDRAIFIHNIYGEYFVASWMSKNLNIVREQADLKLFFFKEAYNNIRLLFDVILAKSCPAHLAVLHNNFRSLRKNNNEIKLKDKAGRSPLHLACSWGEKRPVLPVEKEEDLLLIDDSYAKETKEDSLQYEKILHFLIKRRKCDPFEKDNLFSWDCVEYATNSLCLLAVEVIAGNQNLKVSSLQKYNDCIIWYYGIRFGYTNLLKKMETVPYIELKGNRNNLLHEAIFYRRNEYLEKLFTNPIYRRHINKKNNNRVFVLRTKSTPPALFPKMSKSLASYMLSDLEWIEEDNSFKVYRVTKEAPLHIAAEKGNSKTIKILLEKGADINIVNHHSRNALHLATVNQHLDVVKLLIKTGASINETDVWGENVLHIAALTGNCQLVEYILKQNVLLTYEYDEFIASPLDIVVFGNRIDALQIILKRINLLPNYVRHLLIFPPLMRAIQCGRTEIVKYLVRNGMDVNVTDEKTKITPLHLAAACGELEITSFLIENKANINVIGWKNGVTPLHLAVEKGHTKVVQLLVQKGADLNKTFEQGYSPLHYSAWFGKLEAAKILIENNANINLCDRSGKTPLLLAVEKGHTKIVELLVQKGADINKFGVLGGTSLHYFAWLGKLEAAQILIENNANINSCDQRGRTPLHLVVFTGHTKMVQLLVQNEVDVNKTDKQGAAPLHYAVDCGMLEIAQILIENNANVNLCDQFGGTPLLKAVLKNELRLTVMLLEAGADSSQTSPNGNSILIASIYSKHKEIYMFLIKNCKKYKLNIEMRNHAGFDALFLVVEEGDQHATKLLLENGASTTVKYPNDISIVYIATKAGNVDILKLLMKHGADINLPDDKMATPLHVAAYLGRSDCARILLQKGANPCAGHPFVLTPREVAAANGHHDLYQLIDRFVDQYLIFLTQLYTYYATYYIGT